MPPRSLSSAGSDGRESYWADGYGPSATSSRPWFRRHQRHPNHYPLSRGPDGYYYYPSSDGAMMGDSEFYSPDGRSKRYYRGRRSRPMSIDQECVPFEEILEADERERRSRRGGDWLLLACATMVAAALYLFGDGEKKRMKRDRERVHPRGEVGAAVAGSGKRGRGSGRSERSRSMSRRAKMRRREETGVHARRERV